MYGGWRKCLSIHGGRGFWFAEHFKRTRSPFSSRVDKDFIPIESLHRRKPFDGVIERLTGDHNQRQTAHHGDQQGGEIEFTQLSNLIKYDPNAPSVQQQSLVAMVRISFHFGGLKASAIDSRHSIFIPKEIRIISKRI